MNSFWLNFLAVLQLDCTLYPTLKAQSPNLLEGQGSPLSMEYFYSHVMYLWASQVVLVVKNLPASAGDIRDTGSIPGLGRSPGEGSGSSFQYSCLENPITGGLLGYSPYGHKESHMIEST